MSLLSANLQAFITIVRNGTVHAAATELHLTQTAVTQRIRALEKELGTTLFIRSRKGMRPTQEGEALLRYCQNVEGLEGEVLSQIGAAGSQRYVDLTITGPTSVIEGRVIDQCKDIYLEWPKLQLHFMVSDSSERLNLVRSGKASCALIPPGDVPNEMDSKLLKPEKFILVGSPMWKGRKLVDILQRERIIDFNENDLTTKNYLKNFDLLSYIHRPRIFVNNNEAIIKLFSYGVGFGTLTQEVAAPYLKRGELMTLNRGALVENPLALVWYPRPEMTSYFRSVVSAIK